MQSANYQPLVHHYAILTATVTLCAMLVGALVTTQDAGMAFRDWPTSDSHNMILYPWLESAGEKFLEHGHRLAGMLIGMFSIGLAAILAWKEKRFWLKLFGGLILTCVILQGLLGGMRVLADDKRMAMAHGLFATIIFTMMAAVALFTSRRWHTPALNRHQTTTVSHLKPVLTITSALILVQFCLGGMLRHLGGMLFEHIGFAAVVLLFSILSMVMLYRSGNTWLSHAGWLLCSLLAIQLALGAAAFVTKYGAVTLGYEVAVHGSLPQVISRTSHSVVGMLLFMSTMLALLRVHRIAYLHQHQSSVHFQNAESLLSLKGGAV